jgi:hypothetical protein
LNSRDSLGPYNASKMARQMAQSRVGTRKAEMMTMA